MKPFTVGYTKCKAFCWFSRRSGKRSFSLKTLFSAICPKDAGFSLVSWGVKNEILNLVDLSTLGTLCNQEYSDTSNCAIIPEIPSGDYLRINNELEVFNNRGILVARGTIVADENGERQYIGAWNSPMGGGLLCNKK